MNNLFKCTVSLLIILLSGFSAQATAPNKNSMPLLVYCGYSETTDPVKKDIVIDDPGTQGAQLSFITKKGIELLVTVTTDLNLENEKLKDISILIIPSTAGGFIEAHARGLTESNRKDNGVSAQIPLPRQDGGLDFVRIACGI